MGDATLKRLVSHTIPTEPGLFILPRQPTPPATGPRSANPCDSSGQITSVRTGLGR